MSNTQTTNNQRSSRTRMIVGSGMLAAVAVVLQTFLEFPIPALIPGFIKFDLSDLPALVGSFAYGPLAGVTIELVKNLIHCLQTKSATVGELSNFILGAVFVATAGFMYMKRKSRKTALIGGIVGALVMGIISVPSNYFVVYPFYYKAFAPQEAVLGAYQAILPGVKNIMECLLIFNLPFTIVKGLACVLVTMLIYKPLSRFLKGNN
ncbi:MAG: ECF transporter S component [Lachnospiraceae bacterium]|nr:ECF transporter S component [Lachnospiraceae bacterium]